MCNRGSLRYYREAIFIHFSKQQGVTSISSMHEALNGRGGEKVDPPSFRVLPSSGMTCVCPSPLFSIGYKVSKMCLCNRWAKWSTGFRTAVTITISIIICIVLRCALWILSQSHLLSPTIRLRVALTLIQGSIEVNHVTFRKLFFRGFNRAIFNSRPRDLNCRLLASTIMRTHASASAWLSPTRNQFPAAGTALWSCSSLTRYRDSWLQCSATCSSLVLHAIRIAFSSWDLVPTFYFYLSFWRNIRTSAK